MTELDVPFLESSLKFEPTDGYRQLRQQCPVHHVDEHDPSFFVVSRFDDVVAMLRNPGLWSNSRGPGVFTQTYGVLGSADDPDHARHRAVLRRTFVPTNIAKLEPVLRQFADELLDKMAGLHGGDWVKTFALPFPALAIGVILGVRPEDRDLFHGMTSTTVAALTGGDVVAYEQARNELGDYIDAQLDERADLADENLPDDALSAMLVARRAGLLDRAEVRHLGHQLLIAGHETTTSLLGMMLYRLLQRPELMARIRADHSLIPRAIEEALRFDSPVNGLFRTNQSACSVHGVDIPEHTKTQVLFAAANRDGDRFERPDEFDIDRSPKELGRHVAFGWGIHFCIGAPLARLEAKVAFEQLLTRFSNIELDGDPRRNESFVLHGLTELPLRWAAA